MATAVGFKWPIYIRFEGDHSTDEEIFRQLREAGLDLFYSPDNTGQ